MINKRNLALGISIIWILAGIAILLTYLRSQNWIWNWETGWNTLAAFATWILAGGIGVAIWQIIITRESTSRQLEEARKSTSAQVAVALSQKLRDKDVLNILRKIYELKCGRIANLINSSENGDKELEHEIIQILDKLELLGALVEQGIVDERIAIVVYGGPTALKCWYKLNGYIKDFLREKAHSLSCKYLEDFAARTWERCYRRGEKIYYYRVKGEPIKNLIEFFEKNPSLRPTRYVQDD